MLVTCVLAHVNHAFGDQDLPRGLSVPVRIVRSCMCWAGAVASAAVLFHHCTCFAARLMPFSVKVEIPTVPDAGKSTIPRWRLTPCSCRNKHPMLPVQP